MPDYVTLEKLRQPSNVLFTYRCLQLLNRFCNDIGNRYLPFMVVLLMLFSVLCHSAMLVYFHILKFRSIPLICGALFSLLVQSVSYYKIGLIEKTSQNWIKTWKYGGFKFGLVRNLDRIQMNKYLKSCEPIYAKVGNWGGKIRKITGLNVMGKTIMFTMKVVMTFRNAN